MSNGSPSGGGGADPNVISPEKAKDPIVILILALFLGGIAYFVLGQWQKGLSAIALWIGGIIFALVTCGVGAMLFFPVAVLIVVDAYMQARILKDGQPIGQWTFFSNHA